MMLATLCFPLVGLVVFVIVNKIHCKKIFFSKNDFYPKYEIHKTWATSRCTENPSTVTQLTASVVSSYRCSFFLDSHS